MTRDQLFAVWLFVASYRIQHGYPPTLREVARVRGISQYSARAALQQLQWEGSLR